MKYMNNLMKYIFMISLLLLTACSEECAPRHAHWRPRPIVGNSIVKVEKPIVQVEPIQKEPVAKIDTVIVNTHDELVASARDATKQARKAHCEKYPNIPFCINQNLGE